MADAVVFNQYAPGGPVEQLNSSLGSAGGSVATLTPTFTNVTLTGLLFESAQISITAGSVRNQASATPLTLEVNRVDTSTGLSAGQTVGDGVALPTSVAGLDITIINNTANIIQVYAKNGSGDTINGIAGSTGVAIPPNCVEMFECPVAGTWYYDAGVGYAGQLNTVLSVAGISAASGGQAGATQLMADFNRVTTATAMQGIALPAAKAGLDIYVLNHSGVAITVYGNNAAGDKIDDVATGTGVVQMNGSVVLYTCYDGNGWYTNGLATGYAVNPQAGTVLETMQFADAVAAAGTSQGTATQLTAAINTVSTVAAGAGVNLPASAPGLSVIVQNTGLNPLLVYPAQSATDTINGVAATVGVSLFTGTAAVFNCTAAGAWTTQAASTKPSAANTVASGATVTLTAANVTGGSSDVTLTFTGSTAVTTLNMPTAAAIVAALHSPTVGTSYKLYFVTPASVTLPAPTTAAGVTLSTNLTGGVQTQAASAWREWVVTVTNVATPAVTVVATGATGTAS